MPIVGNGDARTVLQRDGHAGRRAAAPRADYRRLVVEVDDPRAAVDEINRVAAGSRSQALPRAIAQIERTASSTYLTRCQEAPVHGVRMVDLTYGHLVSGSELDARQRLDEWAKS